MKYFYVFIIGLIIGLALMNVLLSLKIDSLMTQNELNALRISELENKLKNSDEMLKKNTYRIVEEISPHVTLKNHDPKVKAKIEIYVKDKLNNLYGKELDRIDPILIYQIFHKRKVTFDKNTYSLNVTFIVVNTKLDIYLAAEEFTPAAK